MPVDFGQILAALGTGLQERFNVKTLGPDYLDREAQTRGAETSRLFQTATTAQGLYEAQVKRAAEEAAAQREFPGLDPQMAVRLFRMSRAEEDRQIKMEQEKAQTDAYRAQAESARSLAANRPEETERKRQHNEAMQGLAEERNRLAEDRIRMGQDVNDARSRLIEAQISAINAKLEGTYPEGSRGRSVFSPLDFQEVQDQARSNVAKRLNIPMVPVDPNDPAAGTMLAQEPPADQVDAEVQRIVQSYASASGIARSGSGARRPAGPPAAPGAQPSTVNPPASGAGAQDLGACPAAREGRTGTLGGQRVICQGGRLRPQ